MFGRKPRIIRPDFDMVVEAESQKSPQTAGIVDRFGHTISSDNVGHFVLEASTLGAEKSYLRLHNDSLQEDNYQPETAELGARVISLARKALPWAAAASVLLVPAMVGYDGQTASAATMTDAQLDASLSQTHTTLWIMPNPFPAEGKPIGIGGNYKNEFAIVYANGDVYRYNESISTAPSSPLASFATGLTATGLSYVMPGAGINGDIAVAETNGFDTYGLTGGHVNGYGITTPYSIQDLKIDLGKVYVATNGDAGIVKGDQTINEFGTGAYNNVCPVNLVSGLTNRIFAGAGVEYELDSSGMPIISSFLGTDYASMQGYGLTENTLLTVRGNGEIDCYSNPFAGNMVPEPATISLLGAGAFILAASRNRFRKENGIFRP